MKTNLRFQTHSCRAAVLAALAALLTLFAAPSARAGTVTVTNNTAGTNIWTCPPGVTSIQVECWGGGGAGGAGAHQSAGSNTSQNGGGGGGGAYARRVSVPVTPGHNYTNIIPPAAVSGANGIANGGGIVSGGTVTFVGDSGVTVTAAGGTGGKCANSGTSNATTGQGGGAGGTTAASVGDAGGTFAGGAGSAGNTGSTSVPGSGGGGAGNANPGGDAVTTSSTTTPGSGGVAGGGAGGAGRGSGNGTSYAGNPGATPGGGGAGAKNCGNSTTYGGTGGLGQILLTYTLIPNVKTNNTDNLNLASSWTVFVPNSTNVAVWNNMVTGANTTALGADLTFGGLSIVDPGGLVTINGPNTLTLGAVVPAIDLSAATVDLTLNCPLALDAANVWNVAAARTVTLAGSVSGAFPVTKQGAGTVLFSGANAYTGDTTISAGTLKLGAANVIPDGSGNGNVAVNGTLDLNTFSETINGLSGAGTVDTVAGGNPTLTVGGNNQSSTFSGVILNTSGTLNLNKTGSGTLTLTSANSYSGNTTVSQGKLVVTATQTAAGAVTNNATLGVTASGTSQWQPASLTLENPCTLEFNSVQNPGTTTAPLAPSSPVGTVSGVTVNVNNLTVTGLPAIGNSYPLLGNAGSTSGYTLGAQPFALGGHLDINGTTLVYVVDSAPDIWAGTDGTNPSWWDISTTANWGGGATAGKYTDGDNVLFDDKAASTAVSLQAPVSPATVAFNNSSKNYTITGSGANVIGGSGGLTLKGSGTVTLAGGAHTFSGTTTISAGTLQLGDGTSGNDGTIGNSLSVVNNGTLVYNRSGSTSYGGVISGSGTVTKTGAGTQTLTGVNTYSGATTISGGTLQLGDGTSGNDGTIGNSLSVVNNGALVYNRFGSTTYGGVISGTGTVTMSGTGTQTLTGANTYTGATTVSAGELDIANWGAATLGTMTVANTAATSTLGISGGTLSLGANNLYVGTGTGSAVGIVNQTGGTVSFASPSAALLIGNGSGNNSGTYNLSNGTLTSYASTTRGVMIGVNSGNTATFNLSGTGNLALGLGELAVGRNDSVSTNCTVAFNQTGGTATVGYLSVGGYASATTTTANFSLTGGSFTATNFQNLVAAASSSATITLGGSAQVTLPAFPVPAGTASLTFDFTTGWLAPQAASAVYLRSLTAAYLTTNGANFNVASGNDLTVAQAFQDAPAQAGVLKKTGTGTLTLTGANTYSGATTVSAGELKFSTAGSATTSVTVATGATNGVLVASANGQWVNAGSLTNNNGSVVDINFGGAVPSPSVAPIKVANLSLGTGLTLQITGGGFVAAQSYPLITWTGSGPADASAFTTVVPPYRVTGNLSVSGKTLYFNVTGTTAPLSWNTGNGTWDTSTANWLDAALAPATYMDSQDWVLFDEASGATGNPTITLTNTLSPVKVTMKSSSHDYTISGAGGIGGSGSLTLDAANTRTLTLSTANTYAGGTTISGGTLVANNANALGTGPVINNGTLNLVAGGVTYSGLQTSLAGSGTNNVTLATGSTTTILYGDYSQFTGVWNIGIGNAGGKTAMNSPTDNPAVVYNVLSNATAFFASPGTNYSGTAYLYGGTPGENYGQLRLQNTQWSGPVILAGPSSTAAGKGTFGVLTPYVGNYSGPISEMNGSQPLVIAGTGTSILGGANTFTGPTLFTTASTLVLSNQLALQNSTLNFTTTYADNLRFAAGINSFTLGGLTGNGSVDLDDLASQPVALTVGGNGQSTTYSGVLSGAGSLTKVGAGTLTLTNQNTYSGNTTINAGELVGVTGGSCSYSVVTVASTGATLGVSPADNNSYWVCAELTFAAAGTLDFNFGSVSPSPSQFPPPLAIAGNLNFTATPTVIVRGASIVSLPIGSYPLVYWQNNLNGTPPTSVILPPGVAGYLSVNSGELYLNITTAGAQPLYWAANSGVWDINTSSNWIDANGITAYQENILGGEAVVFDDVASGAGPDITVTLATNVAPSSVTFSNSVKNFTLSGAGGITGTGGVTQTGTGTNTLTTANSYTGTTTISAGTLQLGDGTSGHDGTISNSPSVVNNGALVYNRFGSAAYGGVISGSGTVTKAGAGTQTLTAVNTYTGTTTVSTGTLQIGGAGKLGNGSYAGAISIASGGTLEYSSTVAQTLSGALTGAGALTADSTNANTLTLSGTANTYSGLTTIANGIRLSVGPANLSPNTTFNIVGTTTVGGQLFLTAAGTVPNNMTLSGVGFQDNGVNYGAVRTASGTVLGGTITLGGNARIAGHAGAGGTITGQLIGSGGYGLDFLNGNAANNTTGTYLLQNTGPANDYNGYTSISSVDYAGASYTGCKTVLKLGASEQIPNGAGAGLLVFNGANANHISVFELNGFNETLNGVSNSAPAGAIIQNTNAGASTLTIGDADTNSAFSGAINDGGAGKTLALTKIGAGTLTLSGTGTFIGNITVNGGTLAAAAGIAGSGSGNPTALGSALNSRTITVNPGATLEFDAANVFSHNFGDTVTPTLNINGGTVTNANPGALPNGVNNALNNVALTNGTLSASVGQINGYAAWNINGTITSSGNSFITTTEPVHGTVMLNSTAAGNVPTNTPVNVQDGVLTISAPLVESDQDNKISGLTKTGLGTLALTGASTYSGGTVVNGGTLLVNNTSGSGTGTNGVTVNSGGTLGGTGAIMGMVTNNAGGTLAAGTNGVGALTINGNLTLNAGSTNTFAVNGSTPANTRIALGAAVTYGGVLNIVTNGSFTAGQTFTLFSGAGAVSPGNFSVLGNPGAGLAFTFTNGVLSVVNAGPSVPAHLTNSVSGGVLSLSWPAGQGWRLEYQTNALSTGLSTNWLPAGDSSVSSTNITIDPTQPTAFYRLVYP